MGTLTYMKIGKFWRGGGHFEGVLKYFKYSFTYKFKKQSSTAPILPFQTFITASMVFAMQMWTCTVEVDRYILDIKKIFFFAVLFSLFTRKLALYSDLNVLI